MADTVLTPTAASEARDFSEYKKIRNSTSQPVVKEADSPSGSEDPDSDLPPIGGETETAPEAAKSQARQERPSEKRIRQLNEKLKENEAKLAKQAEELESLRNRNRNPEPPKPAEQPKAEAKPATDEEPDFEKFYEAAIKDKANTTWEKAQADAMRKYQAAVREHDRKTVEAERSKTEAKTAHDARITKTRERHADFDEAIAKAIPQVEGIHNPGVEAALATFDSADALYHFATHLDEFRRICSMSPQVAYRETVALDLKLANATPEKEKHEPEEEKTPVSRAPKPAAAVRATTANGAPKSPAEARDYAEYKRLRTAKAS